MNVVIRAEHLSKEYRLGVINHGMLYKDLQSWMARKLGKPDPHAQIGSDRYADQNDRFWALKDVSFDVKQGDRLGIIGRNGAGKSTLLKILSRITAPTEGSVKIKGRVASLLEVGTGFHGELTGRENIFLNGAILGMKKYEIEKKLDEIIDFSGIENHIDTPVKRYSSGMYVRLAFAVAANLESEILLADEVLAVGDAEFQKKAIGKMQDLSTSSGRTVIFVSHQMSAIKRLCTNGGLVLEKGRIIDVCDSAESLVGTYAQRIAAKDSIGQQFNGENCENENISLIMASVASNGDGKDIDIETGFMIDVLFKCKHEGLNLDCTIHITDSEDTLVSHRPGIITCRHDSKVGNYHLTANYPGYVMNAGTYKVSFIFGSNQQDVLLRKDNALQFEVHEIVYEEGLVLRKTPGFIYPKIAWNHEFISE
jgi:lipopolysaccharide transport system ATP-binding protein